jgi:hypothetical protein
MKKRMTRAQLETAKLRSADAFDFLQDDPDEAERVDALSIEDFADERGIEMIENPVILAFIDRKFSKLEKRITKFKRRLLKDEAERSETNGRKAVKRRFASARRLHR